MNAICAEVLKTTPRLRDEQEDWVCCHTYGWLLNKRIQSRICKGKRLGEKLGDKHKPLKASLSGVTYHMLDSLTTGNTLYQGKLLRLQGPGILPGADPAGTLCLTHTLKRVPDF